MRAYYRAYGHGGLGGRGTRRLHILREAPLPTRAKASLHDRTAQGECGQSARTHTGSEPRYLPTVPAVPPPGLTWCATCLGRAAERLGLLDAVAGLVVARLHEPAPRGEAIGG